MTVNLQRQSATTIQQRDNTTTEKMFTKTPQVKKLVVGLLKEKENVFVWLVTVRSYIYFPNSTSSESNGLKKKK